MEWTVEYAAGEFGINPRTLTKNLKQNGSEPSFKSTGRFSTAQIASAVFGAKHLADLRLKNADAEAAEMRNLEAKGKLVDIDKFLAATEPIMASLKQRIMNLPIADPLKDDICSAAADLFKNARQ